MTGDVSQFRSGFGVGRTRRDDIARQKVRDDVCLDAEVRVLRDSGFTLNRWV